MVDKITPSKISSVRLSGVLDEEDICDSNRPCLFPRIGSVPRAKQEKRAIAQAGRLKNDGDGDSFTRASLVLIGVLWQLRFTRVTVTSHE